jgi:DNA-binding response OmpR family regulator
MNPSSSALFQNVLLVEDESRLASTLMLALKKLNLKATHVSTLEEAREQLESDAQNPFDLVLLDRVLPDGDGLELLPLLKALDTHQNTAMVLILSARGEISERVRGLEEGADDYLPKPFSLEELSARIQALGRRALKLQSRTESTQQRSTQNDESLWTKDANTLKIRGPKGWVVVTQLEFKLLERFLSHPHRVISRDELLKDVWGFQWLPKTRTVDFFMSRIRKNFEIDPEKPCHFITVRGIGYRFDP